MTSEEGRFIFLKEKGYFLTKKHVLIPRHIIWPFILLSSLFAWWGLANNMTDTLLAAFKRIMSFSDAKTALIPILNVSLAAKEIISGTIAPGLLAEVYVSLVVLAGVSLYGCTWWFDREKTMFRES